MTIDHAHLAERFLAGDVQALGQVMSDTSDFDAMSDLGFGICAALTERGEVEVAFNFILSFCNWQGNPDAWIARFAQRIGDEGDKLIAINLWMSLILQGRGDIFAYERCILSYLERGMRDEALALFADARGRFPLSDFSIPTKFNVAALMHDPKDFDQAFALYTDVYSTDPNFKPVVKNIISLARDLGYQPAIKWSEWYSGQIASRAPAASAVEANAPDRIVWRGAEIEEIATAIRAHGFCYIRGGCAPEVVEELRQISVAHDAAGSVFPTVLDDRSFEKLDRLFLFAPKAVLTKLSASDYNIDRSLCAMRRVGSMRTAGTTPFHQDSTAFLRELYNIWVPLTPAGGDYPSIQFVAKLIDFAEQTIISEGDYNQVEIDADLVASKYGDLLRTIDDAQPGDCVMFCGSTIHRSYGMESAPKTRFNIEVRWT